MSVRILTYTKRVTEFQESNKYKSKYGIGRTLWRLVAAFPVRCPGFEPRSVRLGFMVDNASLGQVVSKYLDFYLSLIPSTAPHSPLSTIYGCTIGQTVTHCHSFHRLLHSPLSTIQGCTIGQSLTVTHPTDCSTLTINHRSGLYNRPNSHSLSLIPPTAPHSPLSTIQGCTIGQTVTHCHSSHRLLHTHH
jgi:hypothetical protein